MSHLRHGWSSGWPKDLKGSPLGLLCAIILLLFSRTHSQNHSQVRRNKFLHRNSATGRDGALYSQQFFFFFQINTHFLPYFATGPLSDTNFFPFPFSCLYFITFYRCFQTQIMLALCHWYTPAIEPKSAGEGGWHFPLNGWETPSPQHPISHQSLSFLPSQCLSHLFFPLSSHCQYSGSWLDCHMPPFFFSYLWLLPVHRKYHHCNSLPAVLSTSLLKNL